MIPDSVKFVKCYTPSFYGPVASEGDRKGSRSVIETKNIEQGKRVEDYDEWSYQGYHHRIYVLFDSQKTAVIAVQCVSDHQLRSCPAIAGIADGDTEQEVVRKFGKPDSSKISGVTKNLYYSKIGVSFTLAQQRVYMLGINDARYRTR